MDKKEAIKYLEEKLSEIPDLARLRWNNTEYPVWIDTIRGVVIQVFGRESYEYQKLATPYKISGSYGDVQKSYIHNLQKRAMDIASIIQAWGKLGFETEVKGSSKPSEAFTTRANWKTIKSEFGITKVDFGKKINFVSDPFKRRIIFRDTEHAFVLASSGFSKSAVILAGSVIEELLRMYLEHKNIKSKSDNFDDYIEACKQQPRLLKSGVLRLSDSVRYFRNLVHLSREKTKTHTISKATAKGAVSSIFTIANDF